MHLNREKLEKCLLTECQGAFCQKAVGEMSDRQLIRTYFSMYPPESKKAYSCFITKFKTPDGCAKKLRDKVTKSLHPEQV